MIQARGLCKRYGTFEAVRDVSFTVGKEEVLGLLGPNGAGKTTVMKILTGFHFPSEGSALIQGVSVEEDPVEAKTRTGCLPENVPLYGDLTVEEHLRFAAGARLVPAKKRKGAVQAALELCALVPARNRRVETLSRGYRQRTGLALALVHDPPVLVLDEPTAGLDPNQIVEIRSLIKELGKRKTVILSTHIMGEAEAVCRRVLIMNGGRVAAQGRPEDIAGTEGDAVWELLARGLPSALAAEGRGGAGFTVLSAESRGPDLIRLRLSVSSGGDEAGERLFDWAAAEGFKILSMERKRASMEDIFVKLTDPGEGGKTRKGFSP
ncbi:MAG: ABC transporter ATP-binding protein [Treponema sp.]|jgi:ABC-2 type transport system ATP-binding protein|nr:ABC transporter ATP-binding protein [Treponema sp.]